MKKEYVKPQNRVVELKDKLMQGDGGVIGVSNDDEVGAKQTNYDDNSDAYSDDVWED